MSTTATATPDQPMPRRKLTPRQRVLAWIVRLALIYLLYRVVRNPWPLLHSRVFPALLLWIGFSVYWSIAAKNRAPDKSSESKKSTVFHQIVLNASLLLLLIPVPGLTGWFLPERLHYFVAAGAVIQAVFILLAIWARRHLGRNWSGAVRIGVDHELVRTGPYQLLRHPIYTAMLGMSLGTAISSSQYHALLGLVILIFAYL
ncbi:MAG TPA: isoprenylcysteine carboxylmethyltransferase family protein, partial [Candidatus Angelobacter sp.]|nr:isoprenylcysteine carboxylmethyltransferase family protein [Candidatus Angelobacter sp.]